MFQIKICGITNVDDALNAAAAGADAVGLNFYSGSKRFVDVPTAAEISDALPNEMQRVGVFVNASAAAISEVAQHVGLQHIQLHGDEPPEMLILLPVDVSIIRAWRCGEQGLASLGNYLRNCQMNGRLPNAVLIDADARGEFGGTGRVADWGHITRDREFVEGLPLILGGGLTPKNVAEAIAAVRPDGVDVASGVERRPAHKDATLVQKFVAEARNAFATL